MPSACLITSARALTAISHLLSLFVVLGLSGCAGYLAHREGQAKLAEGQVEPGLSKLKQAVEQSPDNLEYRRNYFNERESTTSTLLRQADAAIEAGDFDGARGRYEQILRVDSGNARAAQGITKVEVARRHWGAIEASLALARSGEVDAAISKTQQVLSENPNHARGVSVLKQLMRQQADRTGKELGLYPKLKAAYRMPVSLSFSNATLLQAFEALKLASGLNYVLDREVKSDARVMLSVTNKPVEDVLRLLMATNQLERRVLDEDTLLIYPNTPAKTAEYREMVVRTFYLSHAEATKVGNLLKTIAKVKDVVVDEKLNLLVIRDTAESVRIAEKLIAAQDLPDPEVMLELEVLEVSASRLLEVGISWPLSGSASLIGAEGVVGSLTLDELRSRSSSLVRVNVGDPAIAAQLRSQKGGANLLANPRVRVRNKQSAKILIGERVPVFTTIATANVGTSESVNYLDVGLKLEIEPTVSLDDEVSMKLALEVSNILETITRTSGTRAYRLGTRNTSTTLRVHDGETNILAGLIQRDERQSNTGIPGLNEIPLLSKLFGAAQDSDTRTEIVLLITPRIVRNLEPPGLGLQEFLSGTESSVGAAPIQLGTSSASPAKTGPSVPVSRPNPSVAPDPVRPLSPQMAPPSAAPLPAAPAMPPALTAPPLIPVPTQLVPMPGAGTPTAPAPAASGAGG